MKIIFIRHGEPNYEIDSLTEKGWREAAFEANGEMERHRFLLLAARTCEGYGFFHTEKRGSRSQNSSMAARI